MKKQKPNNSNDWREKFKDEFCEDDRETIIGYEEAWRIIRFIEEEVISSELQREREKTLKEVREIIENTNWISGTHFVVNGKQEKMVVKHELLSKINKLK